MLNPRGCATSNGLNSNGTCMNVGNKIWDPAEGGRPSIHLYPEYSSGATMKALLCDDDVDCASTTPGNSPSMTRVSSQASFSMSQVQSRESGTGRWGGCEDQQMHHADDTVQGERSSVHLYLAPMKAVLHDELDCAGTAPEDSPSTARGSSQASCSMSQVRSRECGTGGEETHMHHADDMALGERSSVHLYPEDSCSETMKAVPHDELDSASTAPADSPSMARVSSQSSFSMSQVQSTESGTSGEEKHMHVADEITQEVRPSITQDVAKWLLPCKDEQEFASMSPGNSLSLRRLSSQGSCLMSQEGESGASGELKHAHLADDPQGVQAASHSAESTCDFRATAPDRLEDRGSAESTCDLRATAPDRLEDFFPCRATPQPFARAPALHARSSRGGDLATRQMFDKRELRRMNRDKFTKAIDDWRGQYTEPKGARIASSSACQVFVRVRPLFDKESRHGEFEVITANGDWGEVIVHNCLFHSDLVRMHIRNTGYRFPCVFEPDVQNDAVYEQCGAPLVAHAMGGDLATLFMFGQTGSGKTHTMRGIIEEAMFDLFASLHSASDLHESAVSLRAFEIAGKHCVDLLSAPSSHPKLNLYADDAGHTQVVGANVLSLYSAEEILGAIWSALASRKTTAHARNTESSRSHCVLTIDLPSGGSIVLVDCAGTERRQDTEEHTAEQRREAAEINSSLFALKECIRFKQKEHRQYVDDDGSGFHAADSHRHQSPYRTSTLTRVLEESFTRVNAKLFAIGTLAPASIDTEHTLSTLQILQLLQNTSGSSNEPCYEETVEVCSKGLKQNTAVLKPVRPPEHPRHHHRIRSIRQPASARPSTAPHEQTEIAPPRHPRLPQDEKSPASIWEPASPWGGAAQETDKQSQNTPFHAIVREQFRQLDSDGDGMLDMIELGHFLKCIDADITVSDMQSQFDQIDKNGDHRVSFDEFLEFVHPTRNAAQALFPPVRARQRSASCGSNDFQHPESKVLANQRSPAAGSALAFARQKALNERTLQPPKPTNNTRCTGGSHRISPPPTSPRSGAHKSWGRDCLHSFIR